jgi:hypothetical protein
LSDHDEFDEVFGDYGKFVGHVSKTGEIDGSAMARLPQIEADEDGVEDEVILGKKVVTYLLYASGRDLHDFTVTAREGEIEIKTSEFTLKKSLTATVDPATARATYRNGVLSLKVRRTTRGANGRP